MKDAIESAIKVVAGLITSKLSPDEALKYTQSVTNLSHAFGVIANAEREEKR